MAAPNGMNYQALVPPAKLVNKPVNSIELYNIAAKQMTDVVGPEINAKPQYKNANLIKDAASRNRYYKEYALAFSSEINKAAQKAFGSITSMRYGVSVMPNVGELPDLQINQVALTHDGASCKVLLTRNSKGLITSMSVIENTLKQNELVSSNSLEHHGVKGMKWGRTKTRSSTQEQARQDHKQLNKLSKVGNTKVKRQLKNDISERSSNKSYLQEFQKAQSQKAKNDKIKHNIMQAAIYGSLYLAVFGKPQISKGSSYIKSNPGIMNAKVNRSGVFKITNMK